MKRRALASMIGLGLASLLIVHADEAWGRAGSGGSRGSRTTSAPVRPAPAAPTTPATPSRATTQPAPAQPAPQRPGVFGSLMTGIAGFALGGILGGLLFGGLGGDARFGFLDLLLIVGAVFFLFSMFRRPQPAPAYSTAGGGTSAGPADDGGGATLEAAAPVSDLERGLGYLRQMDPSFDPSVLARWAATVFSDVQAAIGARDMRPVSDRLTSEQFARLQAQCDRLQNARQTNRVEQIDLQRVEVSEAWQERGQDYVTLCFRGSLVDCTVDDATGQLVDGSRSPQEFEEYWTFTRPVGPNRWRLSAIQTA